MYQIVLLDVTTGKYRETSQGQAERGVRLIPESHVSFACDTGGSTGIGSDSQTNGPAKAGHVTRTIGHGGSKGWPLASSSGQPCTP